MIVWTWSREWLLERKWLLAVLGPQATGAAESAARPTERARPLDRGSPRGPNMPPVSTRCTMMSSTDIAKIRASSSREACTYLVIPQMSTRSPSHEA